MTEVVGHMEVRKNVPGRGNSKSRGPKAGVCLAHLTNHKEATVAGLERAKAQ